MSCHVENRRSEQRALLRSLTVRIQKSLPLSSNLQHSIPSNHSTQVRFNGSFHKRSSYVLLNSRHRSKSINSISPFFFPRIPSFRGIDNRKGSLLTFRKEICCFSKQRNPRRLYLQNFILDTLRELIRRMRAPRMSTYLKLATQKHMHN